MRSAHRRATRSVSVSGRLRPYISDSVRRGAPRARPGAGQGHLRGAASPRTLRPGRPRAPPFLFQYTIFKYTYRGIKTCCSHVPSCDRPGGAEGRTAALNRTVNHLETRLNSAPIPTGRPRRGCAKPPRSGAHAQALHRERIHAIPAHWQHASIRHHGALAAPSTRRTACPRSSRAQGRRRCLLSLLFQPKVPPRGRYP